MRGVPQSGGGSVIRCGVFGSTTTFHRQTSTVCHDEHTRSDVRRPQSSPALLVSPFSDVHCRPDTLRLTTEIVHLLSNMVRQQETQGYFALQCGSRLFTTIGSGCHRPPQPLSRDPARICPNHVFVRP